MPLFTKLSSDETLTDFQRADAMEQAVECLLRLERFDAAEGLADQIESQPVSVICQMRIPKARRKGKELVERFRDHDFPTGPTAARETHTFSEEPPLISEEIPN